MIATGQFLAMIERLEKQATSDRKKMNESCLVMTLKREEHCYFDGYEAAIRAMFRELETEI